MDLRDDKTPELEEETWEVIKSELVEKKLSKVALHELKNEKKSPVNQVIHYKADYQKAMEGVATFNAPKFAKLTSEMDMNNAGQSIPSDDLDFLKSLIISESCMDKEVNQSSRNPKSYISRETTEKMYVFDERRDQFMDQAFKYIPTFVTDRMSQASKKLYQFRDQKIKGVSEANHSFGNFQIQTWLLLQLTCRDPQLIQKAITAIQNDPAIQNHPQAQLTIDFLLWKASPSVEDRVYNILHDPWCVNVIQRLSWNNTFALQICNANYLGNKNTLSNYFGKEYDPYDMRLTCGLAHLLGPNKTCDAILQQNLYLLAQNLGIDINTAAWLGGKKFQIDGFITLEEKKSTLVRDPNDPQWYINQEQTVPGWEARKLFQAIKVKLAQMGVRSLETVAIQDMMGSKWAPARKNMIARLKDTQQQLQAKGIPYQFKSLLSVSDLKPLEQQGKTHLRYIYHYLNALQASGSQLQAPGSWGVISENPQPLNSLTFRRYGKQRVKYDAQWLIIWWNMSWLNWLKSGYIEHNKKTNQTLDAKSIDGLSSLWWVKYYRDIFTTKIDKASVVWFINDNQNANIAQEPLQRLLDSVAGDVNKLVVWLGKNKDHIAKAAKVTSIIKDAGGKIVDLEISLPLQNAQDGRYHIKTFPLIASRLSEHYISIARIVW
jgi:hypothetical protein